MPDMRSEIAALLAEYGAAREALRALDREATPRDWAQADLDMSAAAGALRNHVRDAARDLGLVRELGKALGGTGCSVERLAVETDPVHLVVEVTGGAESAPPQWRAAAPSATERVRAVTEDFYSRTGVEVEFPYENLPL